MQPIRNNARALRNAATDAERALWRHLRSRQLQGIKFRRQYPIAGYLADFASPEVRLVIELDGGQHLERMAYDAVRTAALERKGYRVLRYWNDDVLLRADDVLADIHRALTARATPPQPAPSLRESEGATAVATTTATETSTETTTATTATTAISATTARPATIVRGAPASAPSLSPQATGRVGEGCS